MALSTRTRTVIFSLLGCVIIGIFAVPSILRLVFTNKIQATLHEEFGEASTIGNTSVNIWRADATLTDVHIGAPNAAANNKALFIIDSLHYGLKLGSLFGADTNLTNVKASGVNVNVAMDAKGESSLNRMIQELPPASGSLFMDKVQIDGMTISTFVASGPSGVSRQGGRADSILSIESVNANNVLCPAPGKAHREDPASYMLKNVEVKDGNSDAAPARLPLLRIDELTFGTLSSFFGPAPKISSLKITGLNINTSIDEKGESSLSRFVREFPTSTPTRTRAFALDALRIDAVAFSTFVAKKLNGADALAGAVAADSVIKVAAISATKMVLPAPEQNTPAREEPAAFTLENVEVQVGNSAAGASKLPMIKINSFTLGAALSSLFGPDPKLTNLGISGANVNISVDERGESSFSRFIREVPTFKRSSPLAIDSVRFEDLTVSTYVAAKLSHVELPADTADSVLKVATVNATGLVLPPTGELLKREAWTTVVLEAVQASTPSLDSAQGQDATPCIQMGRIAFELTQAVSADTPVRIRHLIAEHAEGMTVYTKVGRAPGLNRAVTSIEQGFGVKEPSEIHESGKPSVTPGGAGLLIEDLKTTMGKLETRGTGASGKEAFWRLNDVSIEAQNLAFGEAVKAPAPGSMKIHSVSESTDGPGSLELTLSDLTGGYPKWNFKTQYRVEHVAATPFSVVMESTEHTGVESGSLNLNFSGDAMDGQLNLEGSVTLSQDFQVSGDAIKRYGVKLSRGKPLAPVKVRGTLEDPKISFPSELAFMSNLLQSVIFSGPVGVMNTVFANTPLSTVMAEGIKDITKIGQGATDIVAKVPVVGSGPVSVIRKIPLIGGLFGKDKDKRETEKKDKEPDTSAH